MLYTGIDLVKIDRIAKSLQNPRFWTRVFSPPERDFLEQKKDPAPSPAANFAAKEAFAKARGTGMRGFALTEVELLREENGCPRLHLTGNAAELAVARGLAEFSVSVTHTKEYAAAVVVGEERD